MPGPYVHTVSMWDSNTVPGRKDIPVGGIFGSSFSTSTMSVGSSVALSATAKSSAEQDEQFVNDVINYLLESGS